MTDTIHDVDSTPSDWRTHTPGTEGWEGSARPGAPNKYLIISADNHANEPFTFFREGVDERYHDRLPRYETRDDGSQWLVTEGWRPQMVVPPTDRAVNEAGRQTVVALSPFSDQLNPEDLERVKAGGPPPDRQADLARDGVDAEIIYPNKGLLAWATLDPQFSTAMCAAWNDWAWDTYAAFNDRSSPVACIAPSDVDGSIRLIEQAASRGIRGVALPSKPTFGPHDPSERNYNDRRFEPLWEALTVHRLPACFHVSSGRDPRSGRGPGGAVSNMIVHSMAPTIEPIVHLCASGVFERHPTLIAGTIETGISYVPWMLNLMDEAYRKHHMWTKPKLAALPSEYYRRNCFSTFMEDPVGIHLAEREGLIDNSLWANDYPHHEGTWPHSAEAIERQMGGLSEADRRKILGENAARIFGFQLAAR